MFTSILGLLIKYIIIIFVITTNFILVLLQLLTRVDSVIEFTSCVTCRQVEIVRLLARAETANDIVVRKHFERVGSVPSNIATDCPNRHTQEHVCLFRSSEFEKGHNHANDSEEDVRKICKWKIAEVTLVIVGLEIVHRVHILGLEVDECQPREREVGWYSVECVPPTWIDEARESASNECKLSQKFARYDWLVKSHLALSHNPACSDLMQIWDESKSETRSGQNDQLSLEICEVSHT